MNFGPFHSPDPVIRIVALFFAAAFGAVWGSYLNVVVYRLPKGLSTVVPGSHCPRCSARIRPWHNIPLVSFLLLAGRCRACGGKISWRYPAVEAATAALFVAAALRFAAGPELVFACYLGFVLLALALIDLDHHALPVPLIAGTCVVALVAQPWLGWTALGPALVAALAAALALAALSRLWRWITGEPGFAAGDALLLAMIAVALGPAATFRSFFFALLAATAVAIPAWFLGRQSARRTLPFGTFLALAALYVHLFDPAWRGPIHAVAGG